MPGGPRRDVSLLNAGAGLYAATVAATIAEGVAMAADAIDSGRAEATLATLVEVSRDVAAGVPA